MDHKAKFRSKKGQLPFVELNGEEIADSAFIIKELTGKFNKDLDACKLIFSALHRNSNESMLSPNRCSFYHRVLLSPQNKLDNLNLFR